MEKMVGKQYEIGLRNLKSLAETGATQTATTA
jgi:hypothetical protein